MAAIICGPNTESTTSCGPNSKPETVPNEVYCSCPSYVEPGIGVNYIGKCFLGPTSKQFYVKDSVPIKTLLAGTSISPWVKIQFVEPCNSFCITTGNVSMATDFNGEVQTNCRAVIKSFQYSWGTTGQGNTAKVIIHDEQGSSFRLFIDRLFKNIEGGTLPRHGVYKVKATWGWYVAGWNGCDSQILPEDGQIICSPECWFIPNAIQSSIQNGKFIYELELIDALQRSQTQLVAKSIGDGKTPMYFTDAVKELGRISLPPFRVGFKQRNDDGTVSDMKFHKQSNSTPTTFDPNRGPALKTWRTEERDPLKIINNWLKAVKAEGGTSDQGRGITMNYDSTYHCRFYDKVSEDSDTDCYATGDPDPEESSPGTCPSCKDDLLPANGRLLLWADPVTSVSGSRLNLASRVKALYIVNGGPCSSVLSFNPAMKWNFQAALKAGGSATTNVGTMAKQSLVNLVQAAGRAIANRVPALQDIIDLLGKTAQPYVEQCIANHHRANYPHYSIEAELRVQGDPSLFLCTPLAGMGQCVAVVVVNPFYLDSAADPNDCPIWTQSPGTGETESSCNEILTSRNWLIKGVDHQIKEGSYITTIKVMLPAGGGELGDRGSPFTPLGGDADFGYVFDSTGYESLGYGTRECIHRYPVGGEAVDSTGCFILDGGSEGYGDFCGPEPCPPNCPAP